MQSTISVSLLCLASYNEIFKWTKWTFSIFNESYGFTGHVVRYLLVKGIYSSQPFLFPCYGWPVTVQYFNGQNGHFLYLMIPMASQVVRLDTFW